VGPRGVVEARRPQRGYRLTAKPAANALVEVARAVGRAGRGSKSASQRPDQVPEQCTDQGLKAGARPRGGENGWPGPGRRSPCRERCNGVLARELRVGPAQWQEYARDAACDAWAEAARAESARRKVALKVCAAKPARLGTVCLQPQPSGVARSRAREA